MTIGVRAFDSPVDGFIHFFIVDKKDGQYRLANPVSLAFAPPVSGGESGIETATSTLKVCPEYAEDLIRAFGRLAIARGLIDPPKLPNPPNPPPEANRLLENAESRLAQSEKLFGLLIEAITRRGAP